MFKKIWKNDRNEEATHKVSFFKKKNRFNADYSI